MMKKREVYIVGNWKMNQTLTEIKDFFLEMTKLKMDLKCHALIAPQFIHIPILKELAFTTGNISIGAQNASHLDSGAFTGDISPKALSDLGVDFVILGHSERRTFFNESNELINQKVLAAFANNLKVIFCVGETLEERKAGKTFEVINTQIEQGLKNVSIDKLPLVMIAYEPVWAIGTGVTATSSQAEEVHKAIREKFQNIGNSAELIILYGGSVKPENIDELLSMPNIDGALVGGASLKASDFKSLCLSGSRF
jgi:triosephosphate isomerase